MSKRKSNSQRFSKRLKPICTLLETDPLNPSIDFSAAETLEALTLVLPQNARIQFEYALLLDTPNNALRYFQNAVDLDPNCAEFHFGLAQCLLHSKIKNSARCTCHNAQVAHLSAWDQREGCAKFHIKLASGIAPENPDYIVASADLLPYDQRDLRIQEFRKALALDENHLEANKRLAKMYRPYYWRENVDMKQVSEARMCAEKVLKFCISKSVKAGMHDIIAACAEKLNDFAMARKHYDLALLAEPREQTRNYHRFLKDCPQHEALYNIAIKMKQSFSVKEGVSVAEFFDRYAILTPGYRALLKRNNPTALISMKQYAKREVQWILLIPPFNDQMFPKVVTKAIMDFLFHI